MKIIQNINFICSLRKKKGRLNRTCEALHMDQFQSIFDILLD